ncbi:agamous-like MADS-box protein AGL29 [Salvia divinorum]|uniref:Agamous-like MADS-box protein AGL29 n=1 Tax=Salvia divinorum TaxID=28513 RepID=A0ABD1HD89_SALDI
MSEKKTRGRQRIPIKLIENKDDLLVSFSKRRVGVYKKASELSTLCGVDVGAIIFSPSGIPHSFFTPDFDSVVHGRRDGNGGGPQSRIHEINKRLDGVVEQQEREERREKHLGGGGGEMGWWEVPLESLDAEQVKEQIEWFQTFRAQIKGRVQELKNGGASSAPAAAEDGGGGGAVLGGESFFAAPVCDDAYGCGGGSGGHGFAPAFDGGRYGYPAAASLDLFGGGIGNEYFPPSSALGGHSLGDGYGYLHRNGKGYGEAGPSN